ncbi:MAG: acyl-ACP thioesterase domain-containing protein [Elusimicrobiaceae bacterium]
MTDNNAVLTLDFRVRCYEQDAKTRLRPVEMFNWFQEAAGVQCRARKIAIEDIIPRGITWIIRRYKIKIDKAPVHEQNCRVKTWAQTSRDLISVRDFVIESDRGERLVSATSEWALLAIKEQRPVRLSSALAEYPQCADRAINENLHPIKMPDGLRVFKTTDFHIPCHWLDLNRHMNNSAYIAAAYENLFPDITGHHKLKEIEINYKKQAFYGQVISCRAFEADGGIIYQSIDLKETGETLAVLRSVWEGEDESSNS